MSLLSIVASSSAFLLPSSAPPKGSSIDSDWSIKNKKQPGFLRLISAWYAMVSLHLSQHDLALRSCMTRQTACRADNSQETLVTTGTSSRGCLQFDGQVVRHPVQSVALMTRWLALAAALSPERGVAAQRRQRVPIRPQA